MSYASSEVPRRWVTIWHTAWRQDKPAHPHEIQMDLGKPVEIKSLTCLPRQDVNRNGCIKDYAVYVSDDINQWGQPVAQGRFVSDASLKTIHFNESVTGQYLRFVALKGFGDDVFASIAELDLIAKEH